MLNDLSFEENNPGQETFLTRDGKFCNEEGCMTALAKVGQIHSSMTTHQLLSTLRMDKYGEEAVGTMEKGHVFAAAISKLVTSVTSL